MSFDQDLMRSDAYRRTCSAVDLRWQPLLQSTVDVFEEPGLHVVYGDPAISWMDWAIDFFCSSPVAGA